MNARSAPAQFDRASQARRAMLAKVHLAKKQLAMVDDDYRALLSRVAGRASAGDCSIEELEAVLAEFTRLGFRPIASKPGVRTARPADHPVARKARALWISLHHLGAVRDPSERALEAFATRQLGCVRMQWADQSLGYRLIEALKTMGARHGWNASVEGVKPEAQVLTLKRRLVDAILAKLHEAGLVPEHWGLVRTAAELGGIELPGALLASAAELDLVAKALGDRLRDPAHALRETEVAR
jgi:phage gp16-like protein